MIKKLNLLFLAVLLLSSVTQAQNFTFQLTSGNSLSGAPGDELIAHATLFNPGSTPVTVDVIRTQNDIPSNWSSSICLDICLQPWFDSTRVVINPGSSQQFSFHFYTDYMAEGSGNATVKFVNVSNTANTISQSFSGSTQFTGLASNARKFPAMTLYPNPFVAGSRIKLDMKNAQTGMLYEVRIYDILGKEAARIKGLSALNNEFSLNLNRGVYIYEVRSASNQQIAKGKINAQ